MYQAPVEFTVAPSDAVPLALERAGLSMHDVDFHEINEAFSVVALANMQVPYCDIFFSHMIAPSCTAAAAVGVVVLGPITT